MGITLFQKSQLVMKYILSFEVPTHQGSKVWYFEYDPSPKKQIWKDKGQWRYLGISFLQKCKTGESDQVGGTEESYNYLVYL